MDLEAVLAELGKLRADIAEIKKRVYDLDVFDFRNVFKHAVRFGSEASARYWLEHMDGLPGFTLRDDLLAYAVDAISVGGQYLEFGVADGGSITWLANRFPTVTIHGFDSFQGIPEKWAFNRAYAYDRGGQVPHVPQNVVLHKGWFDKTVPSFFNVNRDPIAFLHMDADIYSSTKTVLTACADLLVPGTIIQFDEYWNYAGWERHEFKAWQETTREHGIYYEYLGYVSTGEQVAVRVTSRNCLGK